MHFWGNLALPALCPQPSYISLCSVILMCCRVVIYLVLSLCSLKHGSGGFGAGGGGSLNSLEPKPLCWSSDQVQCKGPPEIPWFWDPCFCNGLRVVIHRLLLVMSSLELSLHFSLKCKWYLLILLHPLSFVIVPPSLLCQFLFPSLLIEQAPTLPSSGLSHICWSMTMLSPIHISMLPNSTLSLFSWGYQRIQLS